MKRSLRLSIIFLSIVAYFALAGAGSVLHTHDADGGDHGDCSVCHFACGGAYADIPSDVSVSRSPVAVPVIPHEASVAAVSLAALIPARSPPLP
ncbi:MAG TPA: hypothetical protein P5287_07375 [bacterium]|nr:hypothetical protein [bacterium]